MVESAVRIRAFLWRRMSTKRILFVPDCHVPYHDKKAFSLMLKAGRLLEPDYVIVLGDFADFYSVSSHSKNPDRLQSLEQEVNGVRKCLRSLEDLGARNNVFVAGNHEDRLERYLADRAPELFDSITIPGVLGLSQKWKFVKYKTEYRLGKINVTHDVGSSGSTAHRRAMDVYHSSVVIGHTHIIEYTVRGRAIGSPILGTSFGWLGDFDAVDYMHKAKAKSTWAHGFGVGFMSGGVVHAQPVPIVNGTCCVLGKIIK